MAGEPLDAAVRHLVTGPLGLAATEFSPNGPPDRFAATERRGDGTAWTGTVHDENARLMGGVGRSRRALRPGGGPGPVRRLVGQRRRRRGPGRAAPRRGHLPDRRASAAAAATAGPAPATRFDILGGRWPPTAVSHTGFTGTSLALDPASGLWLVLLTNAVHVGRDATAVQALRRAVHEAVRVTATTPP